MEHLPDEVVEAVLDQCSQISVCSLSRCSRRFHQLANKRLYRCIRVDLHTTHLSKQLIQERKSILYPEIRESKSYVPCTRVGSIAGIAELLKGLSDRPCHSALVKRFEIASFEAYPTWDSMIIAALRACTHLRSLVLADNVLFDESLLSSMPDQCLRAVHLSLRLYPFQANPVVTSRSATEKYQTSLPGANLEKLSLSITQYMSDIFPLSRVLNRSTAALTSLCINVEYESVLSDYSSSPQKRRRYLLRDLLLYSGNMSSVVKLSLKGLVMTPEDVPILLNRFNFSKIISLEWGIVHVQDSRHMDTTTTGAEDVSTIFSQMHSLKHLLLESTNIDDLGTFSNVIASIRPLASLKLRLPDFDSLDQRCGLYQSAMMNIAKFHCSSLKVLSIEGIKGMCAQNKNLESMHNLKSCTKLEFLQLPPIRHLSDITWIQALPDLTYLSVSLRFVCAMLVFQPTYFLDIFERQKGHVLQLISYQPNLQFIKTEDFLLEHSRSSEGFNLTPLKGLDEWFLKQGDFMTI